MSPLHASFSSLSASLAQVLDSPKNNGSLELIVARPRVDERQVLTTGELSLQWGLLGDNWQARGSKATPDGSAHPDMQLNIMNSRAAQLIAGDVSRWPLAGDQLYVDFDLSVDNLPTGTHLAIGAAIVEVTAEPHLGCRKFSDRFGRDATRWVNSVEGKAANLRGINAKVVQPGSISIKDSVHKVT